MLQYWLHTGLRAGLLRRLDARLSRWGWRRLRRWFAQRLAGWLSRGLPCRLQRWLSGRCTGWFAGRQNAWLPRWNYRRLRWRLATRIRRRARARMLTRVSGSHTGLSGRFGRGLARRLDSRLIQRLTAGLPIARRICWETRIMLSNAESAEQCEELKWREEFWAAAINAVAWQNEAERRDEKQVEWQAKGWSACGKHEAECWSKLTSDEQQEAERWVGSAEWRTGRD